MGQADSHHRRCQDQADPGGRDPISEHRAASLFLENELSYRHMRMPEHLQSPPPVLVTDLPLRGDDGFLDAHYEVVRHFDVHVPAAHLSPPQRSDRCSGTGQCFAILRRVDRAGDGTTDHARAPGEPIPE